MKENGCDLTAYVQFHGWTKFFDCLIGPAFPKLVKELLIHATASNHQVTSYVMGKNIVIIEDIIRKDIVHDGSGIRCSEMADKGSDLIFTFGKPSNKIKHLKYHLKIWARIIMGRMNHGKPATSPDYINIDQ